MLLQCFHSFRREHESIRSPCLYPPTPFAVETADAEATTKNTKVRRLPRRSAAHSLVGSTDEQVGELSRLPMGNMGAHLNPHAPQSSTPALMLEGLDSLLSGSISNICSSRRGQFLVGHGPGSLAALRVTLPSPKRAHASIPKRGHPSVELFKIGRRVCGGSTCSDVFVADCSLTNYMSSATKKAKKSTLPVPRGLVLTPNQVEGKPVFSSSPLKRKVIPRLRNSAKWAVLGPG